MPKQAISNVEQHLKGTEDFCSGCLEGFLISEDLFQRHKDCSGLNCTIDLWHSVVLELFPSKC